MAPARRLAGALILSLGGAIATTAAFAVAPAMAATTAGGTITVNGAAVTAVVSSPGVGATYTFSGTAGEIVTASASGGTFAAGCDVGMRITSTTGVVIGGAEANCIGQGSAGFIGETTLPGTGTFDLVLYTNDSDLGKITLSLSADSASSSIKANGPEVSFQATHSGQGRSFTFSGTAGEVVTLTAVTGTYPAACDLGMAIEGVGGTILNSASCVATGGAFIQETALPGKGTYEVHLTPHDGDTGKLTLALSSDLPNSSITANGATVKFTSAHLGQGQSFKFSGTAGEVVTAATSASTFPAQCDLSMEIVGEGTIVSQVSNCVADGGFIPETVLPGTGTYELVVFPRSGATGSLTLSLSEDAAPSTITVSGPAATFTSTHGGQGQVWTFSGTAGEVVSLKGTTGTYPAACDVNVAIASFGVDLGGASANCAGNGIAIGPVTLPGTGTYEVVLTPNNGDAGSLTLALT